MITLMLTEAQQQHFSTYLDNGNAALLNVQVRTIPIEMFSGEELQIMFAKIVDLRNAVNALWHYEYYALEMIKTGQEISAGNYHINMANELIKHVVKREIMAGTSLNDFGIQLQKLALMMNTVIAKLSGKSSQDERACALTIINKVKLSLDIFLEINIDHCNLIRLPILQKVEQQNIGVQVGFDDFVLPEVGELTFDDDLFIASSRSSSESELSQLSLKTNESSDFSKRASSTDSTDVVQAVAVQSPVSRPSEHESEMHTPFYKLRNTRIIAKTGFGIFAQETQHEAPATEAKTVETRGRKRKRPQKDDADYVGTAKPAVKSYRQ